MSAERIRRRNVPAGTPPPTAATVALPHDPLTIAGAAGAVRLLVSDEITQREVAHAAWRILTSAGGLLNRVDIAARHNLSRQRTYQLTTQKNFPAPVGQVGGHPVWLAVDVDQYRAEPNTGGRPRKTPVDTADEP